ncbi:family 16 glycosylhydrolase [Cereibacter sphaeroides]|uniref:family 16 glycosylhydrolase n=1 Tax=Cereibacter sphaeroides TaxID=1063 RepID=UPI001F30442E|nr:family 16 glycosylhydrolase [Cereibacter sphaeroides]MCE6950191.1 family 16 glycosylhydrolase [Cereibacter sphaeroides]
MYITHDNNSFLVSTWDAGQSYLTRWSENNVIVGDDGRIGLKLSRAPDSTTRPWIGGEIQSEEAFTTGSWSWMAQAPEMVDGAVFGLFLYQADYRTQPWREYDIEFVGGDTTQMEVTVHFLDRSGRHVTTIDKHVIDLGFDASDAPHVYSIDVTSTNAIFRVDGEVVDVIDASDVQGGVWDPGPLKSLADLWVTTPDMAQWAGTWRDPGVPLTGYVENIRLADDSTLFGNRLANAITGTAAADLIYGFGGNDTLSGGAGADRLHGGAGNDTYLIVDTADRVVERAGEGTDVIKSSVSWTLGANVEQLILTGRTAIDGTGNALANLLVGNSAANRLQGGGGNDRLEGREGNDVLNTASGNDRLLGNSGHDRLIGGGGNDTMSGGWGNDTFVFSRGSGNDVITDFIAAGTDDRMEISGYAAVQQLRQVGADTLVVLSTTDSILLTNVQSSALTAGDFVFV